MSPGTTLEQWLVLQTVIEEGSYVRAAERLCRSQSSVSYALASLQERLGIELLEIVGRKAALTEAGRLMLEQVRPLIEGFRLLEARASGMREGLRPSVSLIVDSVFPKPQLFAALRAFQSAYPQVQVHVAELLRTESEQALRQHEAELYVITQKPEDRAGASLLMEVEFAALAGAGHPLQRIEGPLGAAQLEQHPLVMIADRTEQRTRIRGQGSVWSFTTIEAAIEAVCHGVGYGWLPLHRVSGQIERGELRALALLAGERRKTPLYLVFDNEGLAYDRAVAALAGFLREAGAPA